ncbi:MAG TPA: ABC transporter ATP-binding protein [Bryobacteraceae bacterium]|nr:ABC transporter ATP-binding protein [Bryobacteraceae bacterium]
MSAAAESGLAVEFSHVSKSYSIYAAPRDRLKELALLNRRSFHTDFWALRDVSFDVRRGETFCVLGENGSGKSTLLQICAGILQPTSGTAVAQGRVAALLELGSGFNPEFSGRDNVYLNGSILGLSAKEMDRRFPEIAAFAEIGDFIDQPVKTYSSGMVVRLAFAVSIHLDPEILLVDEALAVGDVYFRQRCMRKIHELRSNGITILFVSHSTSDVKALGDRALWLDKGCVKALGRTDLVVAQYLAAMSAKDMAYQARDLHPIRSTPSIAEDVVEGIPNIDHRFGDGKAEIIGIAVLDTDGSRVAALEPNSTIVVRISVRAKATLDRPIVGFMFRNHLGVDFAGTNTARERADLEPMFDRDIATVDFYVDLPPLYASSFSFSPAIANGSLEQYSICDWIDNAVVLQMQKSDQPIYGQFHLPCRVQVNRKIEAAKPAREETAVR